MSAHEHPLHDSPSALPTAPPTPASLFWWATAWAAVCVLGCITFAMNLSRIVDADFSGQRSWGFIAILPIMAGLIAALCIGRGVRTVGPWREYRARWSADQRARAEQARLAAEPSTPLIVLGTVIGFIWIAGVAAAAVFLPSSASGPDGLVVAITLPVVVAMLWIPVLRAGLCRRRASIVTATSVIPPLTAGAEPPQTRW